jgi:hypothetical protein
MVEGVDRRKEMVDCRLRVLFPALPSSAKHRCSRQQWACENRALDMRETAIVDINEKR